MNPEIKKSFRADRFTAEYPVEPEHEGMRLDSFIHVYMPTLSREFLKKKIEKGDVEISGRKPPHKPSTKVHHKESVKITTHNTPELEDEEWMGKPLDLSAVPEVIFEDSGLIVCNKPAFMTTHPAGRHLFYVATTYFSTIHDKVIHSIHRLDRETSGVLLLGKETKVANLISEMFEEDKIRKCYFLISKHSTEKRAMPFLAEERLGERPGIPRGMHQWHNKHSIEGKDAETEFWMIHQIENY
ncbi:MAG: pseudouridine synthase, partial [Proteobacteria bacterium]|nr:pseudouridine synthase [Pseudomonadota bacterium]